MTILVAYGEIALKGEYVRRSLEMTLCGQLEYMLDREGFDGFMVQRRYGRIYIRDIPDEAAGGVARVFGVVSAMPARETDSSFNSVISLMVEGAKREIREGQTFAVRPKVVGVDDYSSRDVAVEGGSAVLEELEDQGVSVDLDNPDVTLYVEIRDKDAFVYTRVFEGVGGLPYGTQGSMVSLFSGGIDSPVATWLMMKRGVDTAPLLMDQRPYVGDSFIRRAVRSFDAISAYVPSDEFKLYSAPIEPVLSRIKDSVHSRIRCILCKRSMYRIAEIFTNSRGANGVVTGESLGQVASQTLSNLYVLDESVDIPVIRPLIGLDKVEIEHLAQEIGTYEVTARSVDGCTLVPANPVTTSDLSDVKRIEADLDLPELCKTAASKIKALTP